MRHQSGFELADVDLRMRGEGRLLGEAQSGRTDLRYARLHSDRKLLEQAREDALRILEEGIDDVLAQAASDRFGDLIEALRRA